MKLSNIIKTSSFVCLLSAFHVNAANVNLGVNEAKVIKFEQKISSVYIANPSISDYKIINNKKLIITGKKIGRTSFFVNGESGGEIYKATIVVEEKLEGIKRAVNLQYPFSKIKIVNRSHQIILYGTVSSEEDRDGIYDLVGTLLDADREIKELDTSSGNDDADVEGIEGVVDTSILDTVSYANIINKIKISFPQQINVRVKIIEVSSSITNDLGVKWSSLLSGGTMGQNGQFNVSSGFSLDDVAALVSAVSKNSNGQILAQPNISVMSGKTASILVGGELPIISQTSDTFSVEYKEFGVKLDIAAKVISADEIIISVVTGVSGIDNEYKIGNIPAFKSRRIKSTFKVRDGGSFAMAGLINSEDRETLEKIPFIGDVPILGAFFRSSGTERVQTELVVIATVNLVREISNDDITLPGMKKTSDFYRWLGLNEDSEAVQSNKFDELISDGGFSQ